jgi:hypothetical protein
MNRLKILILTSLILVAQIHARNIFGLESDKEDDTFPNRERSQWAKTGGKTAPRDDYSVTSAIKEVLGLDNKFKLQEVT